MLGTTARTRRCKRNWNASASTGENFARKSTMNDTKRSRRSSVGLIGSLLLAMALSGCASRPIKCEIPEAPASLVEPVTKEDQLTELGKIFGQDWSSTEQDAKPSGKK